MDEPGANVPAPTPADRTNEDEIPGARMASLTAYLQVNRDRFTEASLRRSSLEAGYTQAEVDAAWRSIATAATTGPDPAGPRISLPVTIGTAIGFIAGTWFALALGESISQTFGIYGASGAIIWVAAGIIGTVGWLTQRDRHPSVARGLGCGVILVILLPLILVLVVLGFCIATGAIPLGT